MKRREFLSLAGAAAAFPRAAIAQAKVPRVAIVTTAIALDQIQIGKDVNYSALLQELADKGFVEGRTVVLDRHYLPTANADEARKHAQTVLATNPDVIFCGGAVGIAIAAMNLTQITPIIVQGGDLLSQGVVTNIAHPGANVTGTSTRAGADAEGKIVSVLAEALPSMRRLAYANVGTDGQFLATGQSFVDSASNAAARLGLTMVPVTYAPGGGEAEWTKVFQKANEANVQAMVFGTETSASATAQQILVSRLALAARMPAIGNQGGFTDNGCLLSYGPNLPEVSRRSADYIALALHGTKPGDLPVIQPSVFELVVNLQTARAIGVTLLTSILAQATKVIQ